MHGGCTGSFENGQMVVDKIRQMGFSEQLMPMPLTISCHGCGMSFEMECFETKCPECGMVHGVTPCHAFSEENIKAAGINY
jgi:Zn finger protein HypA/HybF involved in hydrogenase expression